jgi:hypothetical protein
MGDLEVIAAFRFNSSSEKRAAPGRPAIFRPLSDWRSPEACSFVGRAQSDRERGTGWCRSRPGELFSSRGGSFTRPCFRPSGRVGGGRVRPRPAPALRFLGSADRRRPKPCQGRSRRRRGRTCRRALRNSLWETLLPNETGRASGPATFHGSTMIKRGGGGSMPPRPGRAPRPQRGGQKKKPGARGDPAPGQGNRTALGQAARPSNGAGVRSGSGSQPVPAKAPAAIRAASAFLRLASDTPSGPALASLTARVSTALGTRL